MRAYDNPLPWFHKTRYSTVPIKSAREGSGVWGSFKRGINLIRLPHGEKSSELRFEITEPEQPALFLLRAGVVQRHHLLQYTLREHVRYRRGGTLPGLVSQWLSYRPMNQSLKKEIKK